MKETFHLSHYQTTVSYYNGENVTLNLEKVTFLALFIRLVAICTTIWSKISLAFFFSFIELIGEQVKVYWTPVIFVSNFWYNNQIVTSCLSSRLKKYVIFLSIHFIRTSSFKRRGNFDQAWGQFTLQLTPSAGEVHKWP